MRWLTRLLAFIAMALPLAADDQAPPVVINSPDTATTFTYGTIKHRQLVWSDAKKTLYAEVTFVDEQPNDLQAEDDTHRFSLPGVKFDQPHGIFYVTTAQGEVIPIAQRKKAFLVSTIDVLPNAIVRVFHHRGNVSVTLEAIRPADVA